MNWGHKITITFLLFFAFIGYMVVGAFQQDFDLVTDQYYAEEINFEKRITQRDNARNLENGVKVIQHKNHINITIPGENDISGTIHFYHPESSRLDKKFQVNKSEMIIPKDLLQNSYYVIKTEWESGNKSFYHQHRLFIQ